MHQKDNKTQAKATRGNPCRFFIDELMQFTLKILHHELAVP